MGHKHQWEHLLQCFPQRETTWNNHHCSSSLCSWHHQHGHICQGHHAQVVSSEVLANTQGWTLDLWRCSSNICRFKIGDFQRLPNHHPRNHWSRDHAIKLRDFQRCPNSKIQSSSQKSRHDDLQSEKHLRQGNKSWGRSDDHGKTSLNIFWIILSHEPGHVGMFLPKSPSKHHQNTHETANVALRCGEFYWIVLDKEQGHGHRWPVEFPICPGSMTGISWRPGVSKAQYEQLEDSNLCMLDSTVEPNSPSSDLAEQHWPQG